MKTLLDIGGVDEMVRHAHFDAIEKDFSATHRAKSFLRWAWVVEAGPPGAFILSDVGPVGCSHSGDRARPLFALASGSTDIVLLPIAHDRVLIGWPSGDQPALTVDTINAAAAVASSEFFIAHAAADGPSRQVASIGTTVTEIDVTPLRDDLRAGTLKAASRRPLSAERSPDQRRGA